MPVGSDLMASTKASFDINYNESPLVDIYHVKDSTLSVRIARYQKALPCIVSTQSPPSQGEQRPLLQRWHNHSLHYCNKPANTDREKHRILTPSQILQLTISVSSAHFSKYSPGVM